ncbi:hypothetical protein Salat_2666400 [Sesamum alatum]|uniref:Uncharacterized protein n=1 Tax=Sesamum alatum TaxID=300844 RepID=A0AAE1XPE5_9LAMI|nr:hypothetical protein Salat_2666400 [Sesamum alatum]
MLEICGGRHRHNQIAPEESSDAPEDDQAVERSRGGPDAPIIISEPNTSVRDSRHFISNWDRQLCTTQQHNDQPRRRHPPIGPKHSYDVGFGVGDVGSWSDYIIHFDVQPYDPTC